MRKWLRFSHAAAAVLGLLLFAAPLWAQTVLSSTTLSAAISTAQALQMTVAASTGFTAPGTGSTQVYALIDTEVVAIRTVNGTSMGIARGQLSTRAATHISGATVWVGPPSAFNSNVPSGQCTRSLLNFVPYIVQGDPGLGVEVGSIWDCLGVTTGGQWVQTNQFGYPVFGSTVSSATTIAPTGTYFKVSGTVNPVSTITVPAGADAGWCIQLEPTGAWVTDTAGNILIASTAVTGKVMTQCWNGSKWAPSY